MQIKKFYIIPETNDEVKFADENILFLLDLSLRRKDTLPLNSYTALITECFNNWKEEKIENGKF